MSTDASRTRENSTVEDDALLARAVVHLTERTNVLKDPDIQQIADIVVDEAVNLIPHVECIVSLVPEGHPTVFTVIAGAGPWAEAKVGGIWPLEGTLNGRALTTQQIVDTDDAARDSVVPQVFHGGEGGEDIHIGRLVPILGSTPLPDGRTLLGVLGFWRPHERFTPSERRLIDSFAKQANIHLINAEALRTATVTRDRMALAHRVGLDLQASLDPADIIARLLQTAVSVVRADRVTLSSLADRIITIEATLGAGGEPTWVGRTYGDEFFDVQPEVGQAVREQRGIFGTGFDVDNAAAEFRDALADVKHTLTLPLVISEETVGMLVLSRANDPPFNRDDLDVLQLIGNIAALALRNARQHETLREADRLKAEFLNMAAHELRTPVTVVQGYLDLIREGAFGDPPQEWSRPLDVVGDKANELGSLVDNILDASRFQKAPPALPPTNVELGAEVASAIERAEGRRTLLNATLTFDAPKEPVLVNASSEYIGRVLDNLINNGLTYHRGTPWIHVSITVNDEATVYVEDHGLGIPTAHHDEVFDQFFRVGKPPWNQVAGTGLGLFLSRQFASAAGGRLTLEESIEGEKSIFALSLPLSS